MSGGGVELVYRCPHALLKESDVWDVFYYFRHYRNGFLPCEGGILDQPSKLMELIDMTGRLLPFYEEKAAEKKKQANDADKKKGS